MSTASAPLEIGRVALTVNDPAKVTAFYSRVLGLDTLSQSGGVAVLGAGGTPLLELRADPAARPRSPQEAGLFHTAFLMPTRDDLGRWLIHAADNRVRLEGASDHWVSEAIYLSDPEGNGIEVYVDRPRDQWPMKDGAIAMTTARLDLNDIAGAATAPWADAPAGMVVGHVHLQVGSLPEADTFYGDTLGFALTTRYPGASFLGAGGYHHHIGANIWNSRGAGVRSYPATGLAELEIRAEPDALAATLARTGASTLADPWGTAVRLTPKAA